MNETGRTCGIEPVSGTDDLPGPCMEFRVKPIEELLRRGHPLACSALKKLNSGVA